MSTRCVSVIAVLTVITATVAFAQGQTAPKASKAEVQKVVGSIKGDKAKLAQFCEITKLDVQAGALAQKNPKDPKLKELSQRMGDIAAKLGPDYERVVKSDLDQESAALFDDLSKSCNVKPLQAAAKVTKADVQKLVDSIKSDKEKLDGFCTQTKLANQAGALAQKNRKDPRLKDITKQIDDLGAKLGPDYQRILASDLDSTSSALLDNLYKNCR